MEKRYEHQLESLKRKEMLQRDRVETRAEETRRNRRGEGRLANAESGRTDYLEQQSFRARENEERQEFIRERIAELKLLAERKLMEEAKMAKEEQERTKEAERVRKEELNLLPPPGPGSPPGRGPPNSSPEFPEHFPENFTETPLTPAEGREYIQSLFPWAHVEQSEFSTEANIRYCMKEDEHREIGVPPRRTPKSKPNAIKKHTTGISKLSPWLVKAYGTESPVTFNNLTF